MQHRNDRPGHDSGLWLLLVTTGQVLALAAALTALGLIAGGLVADLAMAPPGEESAVRLASTTPILPATAAVTLLLGAGLAAATAAVRARHRYRHDDRWTQWRQRFLAG